MELYITNDTTPEDAVQDHAQADESTCGKEDDSCGSDSRVQALAKAFS